MKRIAVVVTARPSYSRIKTAVQALINLGAEPIIMATASARVWRFGNVFEKIAKDFPGHWMLGPATVVDGGGLEESAVSTGLLTVQMANHLAMLKPDCVVTIADRHETLATAIAAAYQHIPLCHVQGGEVSGSIDDKVRNAVTQLADLHLVATAVAFRRVVDARGWSAIHWHQAVTITGCPSIDLAAEALKLGPIHRADVIVLQHPVTGEVDQAGVQMRETIAACGPNALYFWPGDEPGADDMSKELRLAGLHPVRNLEPVEFLRVLLGAKVLVGNSSVGIRECSFLGVPVVNIGTRQEGRERAVNVCDVRHVGALIAQATSVQAQHGPYPSSNLYGDGYAGERIAKALLEWET